VGHAWHLTSLSRVSSINTDLAEAAEAFSQLNCSNHCNLP